MILKKILHHNIEIELKQMNCKIISNKKTLKFQYFCNSHQQKKISKKIKKAQAEEQI